MTNLHAYFCVVIKGPYIDLIKIEYKTGHRQRKHIIQEIQFKKKFQF